MSENKLTKGQIRWIRLTIKWKRFFSVKKQINLEAKHIAQLIVSCRDAEVLMDGEGGYYASVRETYLVLEDTSLHIINGIYYHNLKINDHTHEILKDIFTRRINRDRQILKNKILSKHIRSLNIIMDDINKKVNKEIIE
jgi:hypothetical protein